MSLFRKSQQPRRAPQSYDRGDDHHGYDQEPRLFSGQREQHPGHHYAQEPEGHWDEEGDYPAQPHRQPPPASHARPQPRQQRYSEEMNFSSRPAYSSRVEDMHPRELSFWQEERYYDDEDNRRASPLRFILVIASIVLIAVFGWLAYRWISAPTDANPPVLYADPTPYKVRPDQPGGLQVPYQDRLVYNRLSREGTEPPERLLPAPEQPMNQGQQAQQPVAQVQGAQQQPAQTMAPAQGQQNPMPQQQPMAQPQPGAQQPVALNPQNPGQGQMVSAIQPAQVNGQQSQPQSVGMAQPAHPMQGMPQAQQPQHQSTAASAPQPQSQPLNQPVQMQPSAKAAPQSIDDLIDEVKTKPEPAKKAAESHKTQDVKKTASKVDSKKFRLQVATLASQEAAEKERRRIDAAYKDIVEGLASDAQPVDGQGGVYRVVFGNFANKDVATKHCKKFRDRGFSCIILKPVS